MKHYEPSSTIERLARAICAAQGIDPDESIVWENVARAVLQELHDNPSEAVKAAGADEAFNDHPDADPAADSLDVFRAMLTKALEE